MFTKHSQLTCFSLPFVVIISKKVEEAVMEIVKPLKGPNEEETYNDDFNVEEDYLEEQVKEEPKGLKKIYLIVVLILVAILGYFGFNFLQQGETSKPEITPLLATPIKNENNSSAKEDEAKDLSTLASVAPEIKKIQEETAPVITQASQAKETPLNTPTSVMPKVQKASEEIPPVVIESTKEKQEKVVSKEVIQETPKTEAKKISVQQENLVEKAEPKPSKVEPLEIKLTEVKLVEMPKPVIEKPKVVKVKAPKPQISKAKTVKKKTPSKKPRIVTVKKGDTLAILAKKYYGNSMDFKHIVRANPKLKSHKTPLKLGQKLVIPHVSKTKTVKKKSPSKKRRIITVKEGYSLAYISKKYYGNTNQVKRIIAANPKIKNKNTTLKIGQKIYLPR
jgi:nucleoid-associated protein YgaU